MVDSVAATLELVVANGGEIVQAIGADALAAEWLLSGSGPKPDLIIADLHLPKLSADEFFERHGGLGIPWVVFSGSKDPVKIQLALQLGALEYVEKPSNIDDYAEALWQIIWKWALKGGSPSNT